MPNMDYTKLMTPMGVILILLFMMYMLMDKLVVPLIWQFVKRKEVVPETARAAQGVVVPMPTRIFLTPPEPLDSP